MSKRVLLEDMSPEDQVRFLKFHMETLRDYSDQKMLLSDYHGVMDAAADLRDCEQRIAGLCVAK